MKRLELLRLERLELRLELHWSGWSQSLPRQEQDHQHEAQT